MDVTFEIVSLIEFLITFHVMRFASRPDSATITHIVCIHTHNVCIQT